MDSARASLNKAIDRTGRLTIPMVMYIFQERQRLGGVNGRRPCTFVTQPRISDGVCLDSLEERGPNSYSSYNFSQIFSKMWTFIQNDFTCTRGAIENMPMNVLAMEDTDVETQGFQSIFGSNTELLDPVQEQREVILNKLANGTLDQFDRDIYFNLDSMFGGKPHDVTELCTTEDENSSSNEPLPSGTGIEAPIPHNEHQFTLPDIHWGASDALEEAPLASALDNEGTS